MANVHTSPLATKPKAVDAEFDRRTFLDALLAVAFTFFFVVVSSEIVGLIGNAVGAMQVMVVGNRSAVDPTQLFKYIVTLLK